MLSIPSGALLFFQIKLHDKIIVIPLKEKKNEHAQMVFFIFSIF